MSTIKIDDSRFLLESDNTGRFIVKSKVTGAQYYVEPTGDPHVEWGSVDQASGKMTTKKGWGKNRGSIDPEESLITPENGFEKIHVLQPGQSPLEYIDMIDRKKAEAMS